MTLSDCCKASMRISYGGGIMSIEDCITLKIKPDSSKIENAIPTNKPNASIVGYVRPPKKYSDIMKVTVKTILSIPQFDIPIVNEMLDWQRGQLEYAVAALAIWLTTDVGKYVTERLAIWKIPLQDWDKDVKDFANECRRTGQIFGGGSQEVHLAMQMRKLVSLAGRTDKDADWAKEVHERTNLSIGKRAYADGHVSSIAYRNIRSKTLNKIVSSAMPSLIRKGGDWTEYIESRWWNTPRGTSSLAAITKAKLKGTNSLLDLQLRPIKPVVQEVFDIKTFESKIKEKAKCTARGSTKPEPGLKRRALLAVDDITAFVAGYASKDVEVTTKVDGMVLRQDPADVSEWVNFDIGPNVWRVSNDYTNFNILNSFKSMQLIDIIFAEHWAKVPYKFAKQKQAAHLWVAASLDDATFKCPLGEFKAVNGLWSGHRNTARDNTMLHVVYLDCIKSVMRGLYGNQAASNKQRVCGDDETLAYTNWAAAVTHTLVADALGFQSQIVKGMLSTNHDEFLQLLRFPGSPPKYPVANTILSFCSGNWYKDPVRDLTSTIKDISDHVWDMHLGGVPYNICQELAQAVLNYLMQIKGPDGKLKRLEWWNYRGCGLPEGHPLWGNVRTEMAPTVPILASVQNVPTYATEDSIHREKEIWKNIDTTIKTRVQLQRAQQAYRNVAKNALTKEYDTNAYEIWENRRQQINNMPKQVHVVTPANRWRAVPARAIERSARAVAIRVKFPPELLNTEEMWRALPALKPRDRATLIQGLHDKQKPTVSWRWNMPPLLRAV